MGIEVRTIEAAGPGQVVVLEISGDLTLGRGDRELRDTFKTVLAEGGRRFVLDLARVGYMDSACLGETLACQKRARECGAQIKLVVVARGKPEELFRMTRLDSVFDIYPDVERALAGFHD